MTIKKTSQIPKKSAWEKLPADRKTFLWGKNWGQRKTGKEKSEQLLEKHPREKQKPPNSITKFVACLAEKEGFEGLRPPLAVPKTGGRGVRRCRF